MRKTDSTPAKKHFRTEERVFRVNNQWFFATREGDNGPFGSKKTAEEELKNYLAALELRNQQPRPAPPGPRRDLDLKIWDNRPDAS